MYFVDSFDTLVWDACWHIQISGRFQTVIQNSYSMKNIRNFGLTSTGFSTDYTTRKIIFKYKSDGTCMN